VINYRDRAKRRMSMSSEWQPEDQKLDPEERIDPTEQVQFEDWENDQENVAELGERMPENLDDVRDEIVSDRRLGQEEQD
jgi:hypothetical protein